MRIETKPDNKGVRASRLHVSRSRGALSGILLFILGAWAALVPLIGPSFHLGYTPAPGDSWHWTAARWWLEVLPGLVTMIGGLLLLRSTSRVVTSFGGWLGAAAGAWLVVGPALADPLGLTLGVPNPASSSGTRALAAVLFFYGTGAVIVFLAAGALGRLSVHSLGDVRAAEKRAESEAAAARKAEAKALADRDAAERAAADDRAAAERDAAQQQPYPPNAPVSPGYPSDGPYAAPR